MPKKKLSAKRTFAKPFIPYRMVEVNKADSTGKPIKDEKGQVQKVKVLRADLHVLTPEVVNSGNLELLKKFQQEHESALEGYPAEQKYLEARIHSAEQVQKEREDNLNDLAEGNVPEPPEPDVSEDGFVGFSKLKYDRKQTSNNGCWSCAFSLLLQSRGVDLTQEEIRAWRPNYPEGTPKNEQASPSRQLTMNYDTSNSVFENADLVSNVLPNTGMEQLTLAPLNPEQLTVDGKLPDEKQKKLVHDAVKAEYNKQMKELLRKTFDKALNKDKSPVAVNFNGHYITVTGMHPDGTLRYEESSAKYWPKHTRTMTLDDLVKEGLKQREADAYRSAGMQLCWLKDLKTPEYEKREQEKTVLHPENESFVRVDGKGNVTVDVPMEGTLSSAAGKPADGKVDGKNVETPVTLDQTELEKKLGGKVESFGAKGQFFLGTTERYYPKKVYFKGDPELKQQMEQIRLERQKSDPRFYELCACEFVGSYRGDAHKPYNDKVNDYRTALLTISESIPESGKEMSEKNREKVEKAKETLRTLPAFLNQVQPDGQTGLEVLLGNSNPMYRERARQRLRDLNKVLELGLDMEGVFRETERVREERRAKGEMVDDLHGAVNHKRRMETPLRDAREAKTPEERDRCFSRAVAIHQLWMEAHMAGEENPWPEEEAVAKRAEKIRQTQAFQNVMQQPEYALKNYASKFSPRDPPVQIAKLVGDLAAAEQLLEKKNDRPEKAETNIRQDAAGYGIAERYEKVQNEISEAVGYLDDSERHFFKRANTDRYERALEAVKNIQQKGNPKFMRRSEDMRTSTTVVASPEEVKEAVDEVMDYLKDKFKVRTFDYGKDRFKGFMKFLSATMPRIEFEKYCQKVNKARGVEKKPKHRDYVSPETFLNSSITYTLLESDTKSRIEDGSATMRDYARMAAMQARMDEEDRKNPREFMDVVLNEKDVKMLQVETDAILADPDFVKKYEGYKAAGKLGSLAENHFEALADYKNLKLPDRDSEVHMAPGLGN